MTAIPTTRALANGARFAPAQEATHYESWFLRGNHPTEPRAFWVRYTVYAPARFEERVGELWAIVFDGATSTHVAVRSEVPIARTRYATSGLHVAIGQATLEDGEARGHVHHAGRSIRWHLDWDGGGEPLLLLPERLYRTPLPRAKTLVPRPMVTFHGTLEIDGHVLHVDGWRGSQNHNWGSRHTDAYAWGQVAGFDGADEVFLECASARLRLGPVLTPPLSVLVLREGERETRCNAVTTAMRARAHFAPFAWTLASTEGRVRVHARFEAPREAFVALRYLDPPGGCKVCLNSKIAACTLTVERRGDAPRTYRTTARAAFELLSDLDTGGLELRT
jgi:hypothetical protein